MTASRVDKFFQPVEAITVVEKASVIREGLRRVAAGEDLAAVASDLAAEMLADEPRTVRSFRTLWPDSSGHDDHGRGDEVGDYKGSAKYEEWANRIATGKEKGKGLLRMAGSEKSNDLRWEKTKMLETGQWRGSLDSERAEALEKVIERAPGHEGVVWRGMAVTPQALDQFKPGSEVRMDVMSSWSRDHNVAGAFAQNTRDIDETLSERVVFKLSSKDSTVSIERFAPPVDKAQREVVNRPGARYRIAKVEKRDVQFSYSRMEFKNHKMPATVVHLEEM